MENIGLAKTSVLGYLLVMTSAGGLFTAAASLFAASTLLVKALAVLPALIGIAVLGALFQNWRYG